MKLKNIFLLTDLFIKTYNELNENFKIILVKKLRIK
jgi:hypothetical protein